MNFLAAGPWDMCVPSCFRHMRSVETAERLSLFGAWDLSPRTAKQGAAQKCFRSANAPQIGDGTLCPRPSLKCCADLGVNVRAASTPHLNSRSLSLHYHHNRARRAPTLAPRRAACGKCAPFPSSPPVASVGPSNKRPKSTSLSALKVSV